MRILLATSMLLLGSAVSAQTRLLQPDDRNARETAASLLAFALDTLDDLGPVAGAARLRDCLATAILCLPPDSAARVRAEGMQANCRDGEALALEVGAIVDDLRFQPVVEAELPRGVPGFQALDEIELREYPTYRLVRASMRGGATAAFWPLFSHIKERDIAMTTPVQIDWRDDGQRSRASSMAFLYGSPDLGPTGREGDVEVVDQPPVTVLSIGARGHERPARITELRERLDAWLRVHPEWVVAGPQRTMNYNSPSVPDDRRYFELQVPVQPRGR